MMRKFPLTTVGFLVLAILVSGCRSLPADFDRPDPTYAFEPATEGPMAEFAKAATQGLAPEESGFILVHRNYEDLRWRLAMIDFAQESLDLQTFIWSDNFGRQLLIDRMYRAAEQGVRLRRLVDDFLLGAQDRTVADLHADPNIEIRIWNPGRRRQLGRNLEYVTRLRELNHRLHNKVLIADNRVVLSGGRNISNEYFGLSDRFNFFDVDVMAVGPVVPPTSKMFDRYWNSHQATPGALFHHRASVEDLPGITAQRRQRLEASPHRKIFPLDPRTWDQFLAEALPEIVPGEAEVIYDKPGELAPSQHAKIGLQRFFRQAEREVLVASPYLVPGEVFFEEARMLEERGVEMSIMTNSLGSTNQTIVHAAYSRTRIPMLEAGLDVFEMQYNAAMKDQLDTPPVESRWVGLHAKCAVLDRKRVFIGAYNLTPRSANLNTEMGLLIDSPELGEQLADVLNEAMSPDNAWQLKLDAEGNLKWLSSDGKLTRQPNQSFWRNIKSGLFGLFPLEQHL